MIWLWTAPQAVSHFLILNVSEVSLRTSPFLLSSAFALFVLAPGYVLLAGGLEDWTDFLGDCLVGGLGD